MKFLNKSERLEKLFDSSLDVICSIDKEGRFIDANKAALNVWGYHPEELAGKFYLNMVVEDDRAKTIAAATAIMSGTDMTNFENNYYRKDGTVIPIVWSARWDAEDEIMYCVAKNASEKKYADQRILDAERKSHQTKQLFELFMKNSPLVAWITDIDGVMQYMNPCYLKTYGFSEEHIGKSIFDLFAKDVANTYFQNNLKVVYENRAVETTEPGFTADGRQQTLKIVKFPILHGNVVMCAGWAIDVTVETELKKQIEESLQRYQLVMEATSDIIYDWDVHTNTIHKGHNYYNTLGYSDASISYEKKLSRIHPDDAAQVQTSIDKCILDGTCVRWAERYRYRHQSGEYKHVIDRGFVLRRNGVVIRVIGSIQDITEQEKAHRELQELGRNKDRLLSIIAHDLRSPLSGCASFLDLIVNEFETFTTDEVFNNLVLAQKTMQQVMGLLEELLQWAQNQMQKVACQTEVFAPEHEVGYVVDPLGKQLAEKSISINLAIDPEMTVAADRNMFRCIIRNLTTNAIKFSPAGSTITISGRMVGEHPIFSVIDEGVGMAQEVMDRIMSGNTVRPSFGTKGEKGIGVGLSLTKEFIERCGGKLCIDSMPGKGSTFSFQLPIPGVQASPIEARALTAANN